MLPAWLSAYEIRKAKNRSASTLSYEGGVGYSIASTFMWLTSMYQMLILSRNGKIYGNAWEADLKR